MSIRSFNVEKSIGVYEQDSGSLLFYKGSPEGNVQAEEDTLCFDLTNNLIYKKQTGSDSFGWVLFGSGGGEEMLYTKRVNNNGDYIYIGEASTASLESSAVWRISRTYISPIDGDITILWADGNSNFDNIWSNHLTLSYS